MSDQTVRRAIPDVEATRPAERPPKSPRRRSRRFGVPDAGALAGRVGRSWRALRAGSSTALEAVRPWAERVFRPLRIVSGLGWAVAALAAFAWLAASLLGWIEFSYLASVLLLVLAAGVLFTLGRVRLAVTLDVEPRRVVEGESAAAQLSVTNLAAAGILPLGLEYTVGLAVARYTLPLLGPRATHQEMALIPTSHRGVVVLGPVTTQRGDPFGLMRRQVQWTDPIEVFVHPRTVPLEPLGSGLLRDLEGRTTNDISMSDLAFHTLREYAPGDDRRYIHWRSSAKASSTSGAGTFLVRQFQDTRRSHIAVVVDVDPDSYASPEEFELAVSAGASVAVRAITDEMDLTIVCGQHAAVQPPPAAALDTFARAELDGWTLARATGRLNRLAPDASIVVLVTGSRTSFTEFQRARSYLAPEVNSVALRAELDAPMGLRQSGRTPVLTIGRLADTPRVLAGGQLP